MSEYTPKQWEINNMVTAKKIKELEEGEGGGGTVTVDSALSDTSENPVQNKVITRALNAIKTPLVVTLTATTTAGHYTADISKSDVFVAFSAKRPVFVYEPNHGNMLPVIFATSSQITAAITMNDLTGGKLTIYGVEYMITANDWVETTVQYAVDAEKPLILQVTEVSQTEWRINNVVASAINLAWNSNRNVELRHSGIKFELVNIAYVSGSNYHFKLQGSAVSTTTGELTVYTLDLVNSLTGTLYTNTYEAIPDVS